MIRRLIIPLALCVSALGASIVHADSLPAPKVEYSADRLVETDAGTFGGRVYFALDKERLETSMHGMQNVMILRRDRQIAWTLMPSQRMYQEIDLERAQEQSGSQPSDQVDIAEVGVETVAGGLPGRERALPSPRRELLSDQQYGGAERHRSLRARSQASG